MSKIFEFLAFFFQIGCEKPIALIRGKMAAIDKMMASSVLMVRTPCSGHVLRYISNRECT